MEKWLIVLPPDGAARAVGEVILRECSRVREIKLFEFDTLKYRTAFETWLIKPDADQVVDLINQSLIVKALELSVQVVLTLALTPVTAFAIRLIKKTGCRTVHWFYEDYRQATYWEQVGGEYDHFLAIQKGSFRDLCRQRGVRYHYLPMASSLREQVNPSPNRVNQLTFLGIPSPYRIATLEKISALGAPLTIAGQGWDRYRGPLQPCIHHIAWLDFEQSLELFQRSSAVLHLSYEDPMESRTEGQLSPRLFDALGCGSALVTEKLDRLNDTLGDMLYYSFSDCEEIPGILQRVKSEFNAELSLKNRSNIFRNHLFRHRLREILSIW